MVWWPVKAALNLFFFIFWLPSIPFYELWNFIPEGIMLFCWYIDFFLVIIIGEIALWLGLTGSILGYLYLTSLPDQMTVPVIGSLLVFLF